ncbi:phage antirepressor [Clostridioides difficile]|nr:phage antirepressor Ant [Clostridioides difficile]EGT4002923.1 phage antirepressor Ant [Clostridioides difficile]MBH6911058.1 phage antirepressor [Clostridioides difficile]MBH7983954.1 phage antirepressor [Clostridioides difficile]MBH8031174.1 phage antirepressor [Clostridioides difficile]
MNNLQIFKNNTFGEIRVIEIKEEPWFVGKDVAEKLGYKDTSDALKRHVDDEDKGVGEIPTPGGNQNMRLINESGLYSLILSSKLPNAKAFKRWVTNEILPSIRKTGGYIHTTENMSDDEIMARALQVAQKTIEKKSREIEEKDKVIQLQQPKVLFADAVASSDDSILVGELAKLLKQNGIDTGEKRLFAWLRDNGYLIKRKGEDYNTPTQKSVDLKIMETKKRAIYNPDGSTKITKTPKVTGKGQIYFVNKLKSVNQISILS